jgi:putative spermidine/putrescine transport system ATP-binding protein
MTALHLTTISKSFGRTAVLRDISLTIESGDLFFILGASGCGKSTLLRIIAGLEHQDAGTLLANGESISEVPAHKRGIGMVFQQYALWPHMTVAQNISFGLEVQRVPNRERAARVAEALELVRMNDLGNRYPHEISGGQQQRVALARALAVNPRIILLDEPLSNLDARLREEIRHELQELHSRLRITMIYVTHDQEDALTLATKIALLRSGSVEQVGTPQDLYEAPRTRYVAEFLGSANILACDVTGTTATNATNEAHVTLRSAPAASVTARNPSATPRGNAHLCVRPEAVQVSVEPPDHQHPHLRATVQHVAYKGAHLDIECQTNAGETVLARTLATHAHMGLSHGTNVYLGWSPDAAVIVRDSPHPMS